MLFRKLLRVPAVGGGHADASIAAPVDGHISGGAALRVKDTAESDAKGKGKGKKGEGEGGEEGGGGGGGGGGGSGRLLNLQNGDARSIENVYHMCVYLLFVPLQARGCGVAGSTRTMRSGREAHGRGVVRSDARALAAPRSLVAAMPWIRSFSNDRRVLPWPAASCR